MTKPFIGEWGRELSAGSYARALAALGVLLHADRYWPALRPVEPGLLADLLRGEWERNPGRLWWGVYDERRWERAKDLIRPEAAAAAWDAFRTNLPSAPRLHVVAQYMDDRAAAETYVWLNTVLLHPEAGLASLFFDWWLNTRAGPEPRLRRAWHWPLRVGFLPDDTSRHLKRAIEGNPDWFYERQIRFDLLAAGNEACDLLLSPLDAAETRAGVERARARASAIVLLPQRIEATEEAFVELARLHNAARASAIAFVPTDRNLAEYAQEFFRQVAHDEPLDAALHAAAQGGPWTAPLVVATSWFIEETRLPEVPKRLAARLVERGLTVEAADLLGAATSLVYDSEAHGASDLLEWMAPLEQRLRAPQPRYVQARTRKRDRRDARAIVDAATFERGAWHAVDVHVGPLAEGERPSMPPFPDAEIAWTQEPELLTVVLTAPGCDVCASPESAPDDQLLAHLLEDPPGDSASGEAGEAALAHITIRSAGSSSHATFLLHPRDAERVVARIMILHANRILQTAILEGPIAAAVEDGKEEPSHEDGIKVIALKPEGVVRMSLDELDERQTFDAAFMVNFLLDRSLVTSVTDNVVRLQPFEEGKAAAKRIQASLGEVVERPEAFTETDPEALRDLLVRLAMDGVPLYDSFVKDLGLGKVCSEDTLRVQLVSAHPEAYLPLEFLYEGDAPDFDAQLCPNRMQALRDGTCASCPNRRSSGFVCPVRFWGLNKVIERHAFRGDEAPEVDLVRADAPLPADRRFPAPAVAVFAHSRRAERFQGGKAVIQEVLGSLAATAGTALSAELWTQWKDHVRQHAPTLLVLLPHTDKTQYGEVLEIGREAHLAAAQINASVVGGAEKIIVVLLGCETADPSIRYVSFPTRFRLAGAKIVVGTLTPVLGRHAAPVARTLIEDLHRIWTAGGEGATLGEAIAGVRRRFMERGLPVGLALIAYGDADWVLG